MKSLNRTNPVSNTPTVFLFGGFEPNEKTLLLTVEAPSSQEAHQRMIKVAPLVKVVGAHKLEVLQLGRPSREVPLFMQGYFEATEFRQSRTNSALQ